MPDSQIQRIVTIFRSRLDTLSHLLDQAQTQGDAEALLQNRLAPDMFPLGTQIAFTCNQPRSFAQWCAGQPIANLKPEVPQLDLARQLIADTQALLAGIKAEDTLLDTLKTVGLGPGLSLELPGHAYVEDFLLPNFYFHLSISYALLRQAGVPLGKGDYMRHLAPLLRQS